MFKRKPPTALEVLDRELKRMHSMERQYTSAENIPTWFSRQLSMLQCSLLKEIRLEREYKLTITPPNITLPDPLPDFPRFDGCTVCGHPDNNCNHG